MLLQEAEVQLEYLVGVETQVAQLSETDQDRRVGSRVGGQCFGLVA